MILIVRDVAYWVSGEQKANTYCNNRARGREMAGMAGGDLFTFLGTITGSNQKAPARGGGFGIK